MPSRQDQLHSYQYARQRVVAALVTHDPDPHRSPLRRAGTTVLAGIVVAALAVGGAAGYGLLTGRSTVEPRDESVVFLEQGTGARYVYRRSDGMLHPVLNYTSGLLIAEASAPKVRTASRESLAEVPLGDPMGIPGAPDSLPPARNGLLKNLWTVCSRAPQGGTGTPESVVSLGDAVAGGMPLPVPRADTPPDQLRGLLVADPDGRAYLIHDDKRFLVPAERLFRIRTWFQWNQAALTVAPAWLNAVPAGPDLRPPTIADFGVRSRKVSPFDVGQVLQIRGDGGTADQWGAVLSDGVADLTAVQAKLMQAEPGAYEVRQITPAEYGNLPRSPAQLVAAGLPPEVPVLLNGPDSVCLTYENGDVSLRIGLELPTGTAVTGEPGAPGSVQADRVHVPRSKGAVVVAAGSGTVSIVTDTGRSYPLADRDVLVKLGYAGIRPQAVPAQLVELLPPGPALDPARARRTNP